MKAEMSDFAEALANPLDVVEQIASAHDWMFDRTSDRDISIEVHGHWADYRMFATWHDDLRALLFACAFEMRVPEHQRAEVSKLLTAINEKMLIGHFDMWSEDGLPVYRHAVLLRGVDCASVEQMEDLLDIALTECERFYPAFQYVIWGGKSAEDAVAASVFDTVGEA